MEESKGKDEFTQVYLDTTTFAEVWASNLTTNEIAAELTASWYAIDGQMKHTTSQSLILPANKATPLQRIPYKSEWGDPHRFDRARQACSRRPHAEPIC